MYGNPYYNNFNQPMPQQLSQQPTPITQNFQLSPTHTGLRYVNSADDVRKDLVYYETPYFSKDMRFMWIKNVKGEIRTFNIEEIKPKDEKDLIIEDLQKQLNEMKGKMRNEQQYYKTSDEYESKQFDESIKDEKPSNVSNVKSSKPKSR